MDCNDAMDGECYNNKSFNECLDMCEKSPVCDYGYFIANTKDPKARNICVPLKDRNIEGNNALYRLRRQSIYPEFEDATSTVFINKNTYNFPPIHANNVFFMDNILIKNIETDTFLGDSPLNKKDDEQIHPRFEKNGGLIVHPLQVPPDLTSGPQYVTVKYGDLLIFNLPNTSLVMAPSTSHTNNMEWTARSFNISRDIAYTIVPIMKDKKIGDKVLYSDEFSIKWGVSVLGIDLTHDSKIEILNYNSYKHAKNNNKNVTFKFIPKMKGWYCNNDAQCTEIALEKMIVDKDGIGTYNGLAIGRDPECWGLCKHKVPGQERNIWWFVLPIITVLIIITLIIITVIILKKKKII
jgi:hypothetical protein